jgi:hypothetical protein
MLVQGGPSVLPAVREALGSQNERVKARAIQIVAWQGDLGSMQSLRTIQQTDPQNAELATWAMKKIESIHPKL